MREFLTLLVCFLADALERLRRWLTVRRVLHIVALLIILMCLGQLLAVTDISFLLAADWGLILEVWAAMMLLTARMHGVAAVQRLRRSLRRATNRAAHWMRRGARAPRTRPKAPPPSSSDEDGVWGWAHA
jgi:hypothetical protein